MAKVRVNWGRRADEGLVHLYEVTNTSFNKLYVLAHDEQRAMAIAHSANHIYSPEPISDDHYFRNVKEIKSPIPSELVVCKNSIDRAISERVEGTIHLENNQFSIGGEVF
jgi:hypothetical protein